MRLLSWRGSFQAWLLVEFDGDEDEFVFADVGEVVDEAFSRMQIVKMLRVAGAVGDVGDPQVLRGKELFHGIGCVGCHTPKYVTSRKAENKAHRFQLIWPYSDFLLHDMGEGLADGQQVGLADGREWRTPPLWGVGLTKIVSGHTFFLHDGRARNLTEAILWHEGEAENARNGFMALEKAERDALIAFLESL